MQVTPATTWPVSRTVGGPDGLGRPGPPTSTTPRTQTALPRATHRPPGTTGTTRRPRTRPATPSSASPRTCRLSPRAWCVTATA